MQNAHPLSGGLLLVSWISSKWSYPMYFPQWGVEYRDGFTKCSDCQVTLVTEIVMEGSEYQPELVTVFESNDRPVAGLAKGLLEIARRCWHLLLYAGRRDRRTACAGPKRISVVPVLGPKTARRRPGSNWNC